MHIGLRTWLAIVGLAAGMLLLAACKGSSTTSRPTAAPTYAATSETPHATGPVLTIDDILKKDPGVTKHAVINWGWMFEQSGTLQGFGEPAGDGVLLAVKEINAAGGFQVGDTIYTINLVQRDTKSDITNTIAVTTELIKDQHVNVIWGPATVGDAESTALTQPRNVLQLCPCPDRELTALSSVAKVQQDSRYAFQTLPAASRFLAPGARDTARDYPQFKTFATICINTNTGKSFCKFFSDAYKAAGFTKVAEVIVPEGTTDFAPYLTSLKGDNPDIVLNFVDAGPPQFQLLKQSWQLDVGQFYIGVAIPYDLFETLVGPGIRTKIVSAGAAPRTHAIYTSDKARAYFEDKYKPFKSGTLPPGAFASLLTYDPTYMLAAAMQRAGTVTDTDKIAAAMEAVHFSGVGEDDLYFDSRHIMISGVDSCKLYQGQMTCKHNPPPPVID